MKHIRFVITFFQILLFSAITVTDAQATSNCKDFTTRQYTTDLNKWTCNGGDPAYSGTKTQQSDCSSCNTGYIRTIGGTIDYYICDMSACYGSSIETSGCTKYRDTWYKCVKDSSGDSGDSGGTTTGPCANYTVANWDSTWTDVSSTGNEISISYESSSGCNFSITDSNLIKDATGTFRAKNSLTDRIFCYEK